jgi:hypothetical protein
MKNTLDQSATFASSVPAAQAGPSATDGAFAG